MDLRAYLVEGGTDCRPLLNWLIEHSTDTTARELAAHLSENIEQRMVEQAGTGQYATIHVQYENGTSEAWPIVHRVPGGWQSGAHHYPDDAVIDVSPLTLVAPGLNPP